MSDQPLHPEDLGVHLQGEPISLDQGQLVFTADDDEDDDEYGDIDDDDDINEFQFTSPQQAPAQTTRAPSHGFQFSTGPEVQRYHPAHQISPTVQRVEPINQAQQSQSVPQSQPIQPVVPVQPMQTAPPQVLVQRPEYIEIHKTPAQLTLEKYLPDSEITMWNNFFQTTPHNPELCYVERDHYHKARKSLWYNGYVTIVGDCGDGKSSMAEHLMISFIMKPKTSAGRGAPAMAEREFKENKLPEDQRGIYECVYVNSPEEWYMKVHPKKRQVVIIDDMFGVAATSFHRIEPWLPHLDTMVQTVIDNKPNVLLIVTTHKQHYNKLPAYVLRKRLFSPNYLIDLSISNSTYGMGTIIEKVCASYDFKLGFRDKDELQYERVKEGFPIRCRLFAAVKSFHMEGKQYFDNPKKAFENVIQKVYNFDKIIFYTLAVAVLFDGRLDLDKEVYEQYDDREQKIFKELMEPLNCPLDINLGKIRFAATLLNGVFFSPRQLHCWNFSHEHVFHLVAESINRRIPKKIVELCSHDFLMERIRTGNYMGRKMESCLTVWPKEHSDLAQRLTFEILSGNVRLVASHSALNGEKFINDLFTFMTEMGSLLPVVQQKGSLNRSLFFWTAYYGQEVAVRYYLAYEELKEIREEQWFKDELNAALFSACCGSTFSHGKLAQLLCEHGAQPDSMENLTEAELLELYGDDVVDLLKLKPTLMHIAAQFGAGDAIKTLKYKGLDINAPLADGYTPMYLAIRNTDDGALRALIELKADTDAETPNGIKPIHEAFFAGKENMIRQIHFIDMQKMKTLTMPGNRSLLFAAASSGRQELISMLYNQGNACRGTCISEPWSPLAEAAAQGNLEMVRFIVEKDADINQSSISGWTALHLATLFYHENIVQYLLSKGADANRTTSSKLTPLHIAAENGYGDICQMLLDKGAKAEMTTRDGEFPLTLAAKNKHFNLVEFFMEEGIELPLPKEAEVSASQKEEILMTIMSKASPEYRHRYIFY